MKRRIRIDRLLMVIVGVISIFLLAFFGLKALFKTEDNIIPTEKDDVIKVDLLDYKVYESSLTDFNFVVIDMRFKANKNLDYDLRDLVTNEGNNLADTNTYINELEQHSIYLSKLNIAFDVPKNQKEATISLFIPYSKNLKELILTDNNTKKNFKIDLDKKHADINDLIYKTGDEIITNDYAFQISDAYVLDKMLKDDEPYNFPATIKIYTFELNITKANKELVIEDATFIPNDNSDTFSALDGTYSSFRKDTNSLIGKKLKEGDKGVLFFEIYSPNDENITYDGKIIIKLANEDKPIEVKTELR